MHKYKVGQKVILQCSGLIDEAVIVKLLVGTEYYVQTVKYGKGEADESWLVPIPDYVSEDQIKMLISVLRTS